MNKRDREYVALMGYSGVGPWSAAPPVWRLLRRLGYRVRPPFHCSWWHLALLFTGVFALTIGLPYTVWVAGWTWEALGVAVGGSALGGALYASVIRVWARWLDLAPWKE